MSKSLQEVMGDIDRWEGEVVEFVKFGGAPLPEMTKVIAAMGMLPSTTPTNVKMCLKDVEILEKFKGTLRENIQFLSDFGGLKSPGAHIVEDLLGPNPADPIHIPLHTQQLHCCYLFSQSANTPPFVA